MDKKAPFPIRMEKIMKAAYPGLLFEIGKTDSSWESAIDVATKYAKERHPQNMDNFISAIPTEHAVALWRKFRTIYKIDADLCEEFADQVAGIDDDEEIPADLLLNLPYPCIAVEASPIKASTENGNIQLSGSFLLHASTMPETGKPCLSGQFEDAFGNPVHYFLPIEGTIGESIDALHKFHRENYDGDVSREDSILNAAPILYAAQIVLYLQSLEPDIQTRPVARKRGKSSGKVAKPPKMYDVGVRLGATLRRSKAAEKSTSTGTGTKKRAHTRRGHWHHYWIGSVKSDTRKLTLRWVHPMLVGGNQDGMATLYKIKGEANG